MDSSIKFNVSANTAQFQSGMRQVDTAAKSTAAGIKTAFAGVGNLLVGGAVAAGLKSLMNDFDRVGKLATRFGTSAESIQRVSVAADVAGTNIEQVANAMTKAGVAASQAVEKGGTMAETFERAGINARQFAAAQLDQKLLMVAEAFAAAQGDANKTNAIIEILGTRAGANLIPLISNVQALKDEMGGVSVATDDVVRKIEAANDRITRVFNDVKVGFASLVGFITDTSERFGSLLGGAGFKTIAELEEIEARASAIAQLTNEGVFGMDAVRNAELIAERTAQILEQTRGTAQQIQIAEDSTDRVLDIEKEKTAELARQQEVLQRQEEQRQRSIRSMEQEIALIEAQLTGNKALEESLREQADFNAAMEKTDSFETAANFAATKAAERLHNSSQRIAEEEANARALYAPRGGPRNAPPSEGMRAAMLRGENRGNRARQRGNELAEAGMFRSAVRAFDRADRTADRIAENQRVRDFYGEQFGAGNAGEAFRDFRDTFGGLNTKSMIEKGLEDAGLKYDPTRDEQANFDRLAREQSKTPEERALEEKEMRQKHAPPGGGGGAGGEQGLISQIHSLLQKHMPSIDEKLPQHALA